MATQNTKPVPQAVENKTEVIAALERKIAEAKSEIAKKALKEKLERLKQEAQDSDVEAKKLAAVLLKQRKKIKELAQKDFDALIRRLANKPQYSFLKKYTRDEIIRDMSRKAKPVGWRFKGKNNYKIPSKKQVTEGVKKGNVYYDNRPKKSDVSFPAQLGKGGYVSKGEMVWGKLSASKKAEFLYENFTPEITPRGQELLVGRAFKFLPKNVKIAVERKYANEENYGKGGVSGDIYSIKDSEQFKQLMTTYNDLSDKFGVSNYFIDHNDKSVVFLMPRKEGGTQKTVAIQKYVNSLSDKGFDVFDNAQNNSLKIVNDNSEGEKSAYFKLKLADAVQYSKGGGVEKHKYVVQWLEDDRLNTEYYYSDEYEEAKELYYQIKYDLGDSQYKKIGINIMDIERGEVVFGDEFEYANGGGIGDIESQINALYSKSGFINNHFNWRLKLLEMLQDQSMEAYNIYQKLTKEQKDDVLQEQFEVDNDMGSDGDGDIETSKENLHILLDDAKNGKKYNKGGGITERNDNCIKKVVAMLKKINDVDSYYIVDGKLVIVFEDELQVTDVERANQHLKNIEGCGSVFANEFELGYGEKYKTLTLELKADDFSVGKFAKGGGVGANSKLQRKVDEVNRLIKLVNDNDLTVVDSSSTWQTPMKYQPIVISRGGLKITYKELDLYKYNRTGRSSWEEKKDTVLKRDMEFDNPLNDIAKWHRKALRDSDIQYEDGGEIERDYAGGGSIGDDFNEQDFNSLKKGDEITITYESGISRSNKVELKVQSKTTVGKGKSYQSEKISFINKANPTGVKYYAYKRANGNVGFAIGDMAIWGVKQQNNYGNGGVIKYYDESNAYKLASPSSMPKDLQAKISYDLLRPYFAGNFGWKYENKRHEGYLFNLDDYDKEFIDKQNIKLKQGEKIYRYTNERAAIGGYVFLIKINCDKGLIYFMRIGDFGDESVEFDTKGIKATFINLIKKGEGKSYGDGGEVDFDNIDMPVIRTQFEEEYFEYAKGGNAGEPHRIEQMGKGGGVGRQKFGYEIYVENLTTGEKNVVAQVNGLGDLMIMLRALKDNRIDAGDKTRNYGYKTLNK